MAYGVSTYTGLGFDHLWRLDNDGDDSIGSNDNIDETTPGFVSSIVPEESSANCGDFNGSNDYYELPDDTEINTGTTYKKTISLWFYADNIGTANGGRALWKEGGNYRNLIIYLYDDTVYFGIFENYGASADYVSAAVSTGTLYHLMVTMDLTADSLKMYLNGSLVDSATSLNVGASFAAHSAQNCIGGYELAGEGYNHLGNEVQGFFDGEIADVAYKKESTVLGLSGAKAIYNAGVGGGPGLFFGKTGLP